MAGLNFFTTIKNPAIMPYIDKHHSHLLLKM